MKQTPNKTYSTILLCLLLLLVFGPSGVSAKKKKIRFFTADNASWTVYKGNFARTSAVSEQVKMPIDLAWEKRVGRSIGATPSAVDEFLFISTQDNRIVILNRDTGERMAVRSFKGGFGGSVLIQGVQMFFNTRAPDGKVYCTEINTKHKRIQRQIGPANSSPIMVGNLLYLFTQYGKVISLNSEIGYRNWQQELKGKIEYAPVYQDPYLFVPTLEGTIYKLDSSSGTVLARNRLGGSLFCDLSSDGYNIFGVLIDGEVFCLEPDSLKKVWQVKLDHQFFSGPVYSKNFLFLSSREGWLIKLSAADGKLMWKVRLNGIAVAAPSVTEDYVFTGTKSGEMAVFSADSGERLWYKNVEEGISTSPLIFKDYVYYCTDRGMVYAFHPQ